MSDPLTHLLTPVTVGALSLANRVVMAPMTRNRVTPTLEPTPSVATYYAQRASVGLIVTEATQISSSAIGYPMTPGIHTDAQVQAWRVVTDAVHAQGGHIVQQLWHTGRISHPFTRPDGSDPVAPSAISAAGEILTMQGMQPLPVPRALTVEEIADIVADFAAAARRSIAAGFDGIELHAANGYLIDQFLRDGSNQRTDGYGGSIEGRTRFLREVVEATVEAIGAHRVGVRISPSGTFNGMSESEPERLTTAVAQLLDPYGLAYLHVIDPEDVSAAGAPRPLTALARAAFHGPLITNMGYTAAAAEAVLAAGTADLVAFGVPLLATPDFVERLAAGAALNTPDRATFYGGGDAGYIDYPSLDHVARTEVEASAAVQ